MASTSQTFHGSCKVKVIILASEWGSSKEELSILNRELAIQLAKCPEVEITVFLLGERRFFPLFPQKRLILSNVVTKFGSRTKNRDLKHRRRNGTTTPTGS